MTYKTKKDNSNGKKCRERHNKDDSGQESLVDASSAVKWGMTLGPGGSGASAQPIGMSSCPHLTVSMN